MKTFSKITFLFTLIILILSSCESKKTELESKSKDGSTQIVVHANKSATEPWDLTIEIKKGNKSDKLTTQLYADEINSENVIFHWQNDNSCVITLIDRDNSQRNILISI